ncbi:MAG: insulinase family protein [Opitutae bacterium]|nr:insulinase family protein [Opitutae bacterium]
MKSRLALLACLLITPLLTLAASPGGPPPAAVLPSAASDLPADPGVHWGRLANGLTYAILANPEPKGRASLRLAVRTGSLYETENQRGLAHFLEHMAFNGSTHFPAGTLVEYFQRLGMSFGGDTNASTDFEHTTYQLELPDTKTATLAEAFTYFADVAGGLQFLPAEIDKERGIIESERRARDSVEFRTFLDELDFVVPDTRFPHRIPIGLPEVIATAQRDRFVDFYDTWYRPERMLVVVVGDIDPAAVEPLLKEKFGPLADRSPAPVEPNYGVVAPPRGVEIRLHSEAEAPATTVSIATVSPYAHEADTAANRLKYLPRSLALSMLNRRLSILAKQEGAPFVSGQVGATEQFDTFRNAAIELSCRPDQWRAALTVAEQELRRALEFGFQPAELTEAVADLRNGLEQAVKTAPTRRSPGLADELTDTTLARNVFTRPETELALFAPALEKVTVADCTSALRALWSEAPGRKIFISGNLALPDPVRQIAATYAASQAVKLEPPPPVENAAFAYTDFGPAGTVVKTTAVADLGATLIEFANGVRLDLKPTDFEAGRIRLSVRVGGGTLTMPLTQPGLSLVANTTLTAGGLGRHSADDLQRILAGRTLSLAFAARSDAFTFSGSTNRADLLLQLQVLCAYLTDPGYRPEAMRQMRKAADQLYTSLAHTPEGPLQTEVPRLLASGDPRFGLPPKEVVLARTSAEVRAWLAPEFAHGAIEIAIVGDFDPAATIAAVAKTYGALPPRSPKPAYADARRVALPPAPLTRTFTVPTEIPKGIVELYWPATDARDVRLARRLNLLAEILSDRLRVKIREEMGGTYSPQAGADLSETYPGYGFLVAEATVAPDQARAVADAIRAVAAGLAKNGVTEEELVRAKQPVLTSLRESARTNGYWIGSVLAAAQEEPQRLEWSRTRYSDNESVTAAELTALAKQYLEPARASEFTVLPETVKADAAK